MFVKKFKIHFHLVHPKEDTVLAKANLKSFEQYVSCYFLD